MVQISRGGAKSKCFAQCHICVWIEERKCEDLKEKCEESECFLDRGMLE